VLGVGLVFTSFFVTQFAGAEGFGGEVAATSAGTGTAMLLAPVLAVLLGVVLGREDATPIDVAAATAVGFVAMYFATAVVASSLFSPTAAGPGLGPLVGYTVGVALAGGAAAAVPDRDIPASVGGAALRRTVAFGVAVVLVYTLGYGASALVAGALAGPASGAGPPDRVFGVLDARTALSFGLLFVPIVGLLAGYLGAPDDADERTAAAGAAAAGALGAAITVLAFYAAATLTGPAGSFPAGVLVGLAVGTGLTSAGAAVVAVRD
jgi:hypothetical protein